MNWKATMIFNRRLILGMKFDADKVVTITREKNFFFLFYSSKFQFSIKIILYSSNTSM